MRRLTVKASAAELLAVKALCKLPHDKVQAKTVLDFLINNRHYISVLAAAAAEIKHRLSPEQVCVFLDVIGGRPCLSVSAESEDVDIDTALEDFYADWYDPISIDLGSIRFDALENWASIRLHPERSKHPRE